MTSYSWTGPKVDDLVLRPVAFASRPMHATDELSVAAGGHAFKFYGYGASNTSGTLGVDNLIARFAAD